MNAEVNDSRRETPAGRESILRDTVHRHTYDKLRHRQRITRSSLGGLKSYGQLLRWAEREANKDLERLVNQGVDVHGEGIL